MQPQCHDEQESINRDEQVNPLSVYNLRRDKREGTHL